MAESQQPYPYTEIVNLKQKAQWIETSLSIERLLPYMRSAGYDYEKAFHQYLYNARLSKSLLFPLHILEVTLRNRIQWVLKEAFNRDDWHEDPNFIDMLKPKSKDSLQKAKSNAKSNSIDDVVASSTFEFWTFLLHADYNKFWRTNFSKFSYSNLSLSRGEFFALIKKINDFRNRIAHYEPILDQPYHARYQDILKAIGYINNEVQIWVKSHSTVELVIASQPAPSGQPKPLLKDKADIDFTIVQSSDALLPIPKSRFIYCEDKELILDLREIAQYFLSAVDKDKTLMMDLSTLTIGDIVTNRRIKKNIAIFGDSESFLHAKKIFQSKKIKYLVVTNSNNLVRGIIEKPHRQI